MSDEKPNKPNWKTLVVDDNEMLRDAVRCLATQFIGDADECSDGDEAIMKFTQAFVKKEPYELILLDIEMPRMEGPEVIEKIREYESKVHVADENRVRIVLVTGYPDEETIKEWFTDGHDAYLVKPVSKNKLLDVIAKIER